MGYFQGVSVVELQVGTHLKTHYAPVENSALQVFAYMRFLIRRNMYS